MVPSRQGRAAKDRVAALQLGAGISRNAVALAVNIAGQRHRTHVPGLHRGQPGGRRSAHGGRRP